MHGTTEYIDKAMNAFYFIIIAKGIRRRKLLAQDQQISALKSCGHAERPL